MLPYTENATVGEVLADDRELSTFNQLIRRSGVIKQIDGAGPYTIFAPTNDAFEMLPENALGDIMQDSQHFQHVMAYHVAQGEYRAEGLDDYSGIPTLYGTDVGIITTDRGLSVGGADILEGDIECANGIIHKISNLLMPE